MRETELSKTAFMGKITAGATHEMKNVLAIIKESAGLMEDLLNVGQEESFPIREKFLRILSRIGDQVTRGVNLVNALNGFAHNPDQSVATVDINHLIVELISLCQRFALSKKLTLKNIAPEQPLHLQLRSCQIPDDDLPGHRLAPKHGGPGHNYNNPGCGSTQRRPGRRVLV